MVTAEFRQQAVEFTYHEDHEAHEEKQEAQYVLPRVLGETCSQG